MFQKLWIIKKNHYYYLRKIKNRDLNYLILILNQRNHHQKQRKHRLILKINQSIIYWKIITHQKMLRIISRNQRPQHRKLRNGGISKRIQRRNHLSKQRNRRHGKRLRRLRKRNLRNQQRKIRSWKISLRIKILT